MPDCTRRLFLALLAASRGISQQQSPADDTKSFWNKVYSANQPIFLLQPTALLVDAVKGRPPGKALDIGMGQGRNAIFLARQAWDVTGFDPSDEGASAKIAVPLHALVAREEDFPLGTAQWDLIAMTYVRRLCAGDAARFAVP